MARSSNLAVSRSWKRQRAIYCWWRRPVAAGLALHLEHNNSIKLFSYTLTLPSPKGRGLLMIRRELRLTDGEPIWLFISQVDHARVSGEIVAQRKEPPTTEVIEAISHHDDGWAEWEAAPKFNPKI